jgi:hypothetical protein
VGAGRKHFGLIMQILAGIGAAPFSGTGGTAQDIGSFRYHIFTNSGSFTANGNGSVQAFLVAGGGGGPSGGGGGGGVINFASVNLLGGFNYSCFVGAGSINAGSNGSNSSFTHAGGTLVAIGGGRGGAGDQSGASGGSGGGGGGTCSGPLPSGGAGTSGQGNNGGIGLIGCYPYGHYEAGGGGGWLTAARNLDGTGGNSEDGGIGFPLTNVPDFASMSIFSGMTHLSSGGGGQGDSMVGGTGGGGGPGAGAGVYITVGSAQNATSYGSGGGGGAGATSTTFSLGRAGLIIIRYPRPV